MTCESPDAADSILTRLDTGRLVCRAHPRNLLALGSDLTMYAQFSFGVPGIQAVTKRLSAMGIMT